MSQYFVAMVGFYCDGRILLQWSDFIAMVGFYCDGRILLRWSDFIAMVGFIVIAVF
jgi:hypothetical protein